MATQALQRVRRTAARVFEVTDAVAPVPEPESVTPLPGPPYDLEVHSVWAGYPGAPLPLFVTWTSIYPPDAVWPSWARAGPASRRWPRCSSGC